MTATLPDVAAKKRQVEQSAEQRAAADLVRVAREQGLSLTGPDGLLKQLTKTVIESALAEEMTEHLGYEKHDPAGAGRGNIRNGTRTKTVLTEASGPVEIEVPRDRGGTFEPQIVRKRQRRLEGVDQIVLSLYAKGLTTGEISAHFAEIYGASVSKETISRITDRVLEEMHDWSARPLDEVYAAIFIDAIVVKVRDGQVANRPFYAAIGVSLDGDRDILGLWAGQGGEGAKFWMSVLTDLRNRGVKTRSSWSATDLKACPTWSRMCGLRRSCRPHQLTLRGGGMVSPVTAPLGEDLCRRVPSRPSCRPVPPGGGGPRSGQRESRFERRDEVPARPADR